MNFAMVGMATLSNGDLFNNNVGLLYRHCSCAKVSSTTTTPKISGWLRNLGRSKTNCNKNFSAGQEQNNTPETAGYYVYLEPGQLL